LEEGNLYIDRLDKYESALSGVIFGAFIRYVAMLNSMNTPPAGTYSELVLQLWRSNVIEEDSEISTWWESAVDFTSMSYSIIVHANHFKFRNYLAENA
jgi:hypothetical protein